MTAARHEPRPPSPPTPAGASPTPGCGSSASPAPAASARSSRWWCSRGLAAAVPVGRRHLAQDRDGRGRDALTWFGATASPSTRTASVLRQGNIPRWTFNSLCHRRCDHAHHARACRRLAAYGFSRTRLHRPAVLFGRSSPSIMVPPQVLIVPLFDEMLALDLVDTYWGDHPAAGGRRRRWCSS